MPKYSENTILSAVEDVKYGYSVRKAASCWGVPRTTLRKRLKGGISRCDANERNQRLSKENETRVVQWILDERGLGVAPTPWQVKEFASRLARNKQPLGKRWLEGFLRRNPDIKGFRGKSTNVFKLSRPTQTSPTTHDLTNLGSHSLRYSPSDMIRGQWEQYLILETREREFLLGI